MKQLSVETQRELVEALRSFVEWAEDHRATCKRDGSRPLIDAHRVTRGRKVLAKAEGGE